jgi:branched-chain amino acid transport system ATP-binding protein
MLKIDKLNAWYGTSHILQDVSLHVDRGEVVSLLGRNGAGKTTLLKSVMGLLKKTAGTVSFQGTALLGLPAHARYRHGLAYVPEERRIVPGMTVLENLRLGIIASGKAQDERAIIERIAATFPRLKERLAQEAVTMSGGEQQMLAIARATAAGPAMILLDEPSEGIMPVLVDEMFELFLQLKRQGTTILLVEQSVETALGISDRAYILDQGAIVYSERAGAMLADPAIQERYCAV